jgi:pentatricopeptide repeat protein
MRKAGITPAAATYCAAISACATSTGHWQHALALLSTAGAAGVATVACYNAAINACAVAGNWPKALQLLEEMTHAGVLPDTVSYNRCLKLLL